MICPDCEGKKSIGVLAHFADGKCRPKIMTCFRCKGSGKIPDEMMKWIANGKVMREDRLKRNLSMREEAKRRFLDLIYYNDLEHGKFDNLAF